MKRKEESLLKHFYINPRDTRFSEESALVVKLIKSLIKRSGYVRKVNGTNRSLVSSLKSKCNIKIQFNESHRDFTLYKEIRPDVKLLRVIQSFTELAT